MEVLIKKEIRAEKFAQALDNRIDLEHDDIDKLYLTLSEFDYLRIARKELVERNVSYKTESYLLFFKKKVQYNSYSYRGLKITLIA